MATITLNVNNEINDEFRKLVKSKFGEGKGILGKAIQDAIKKWIFEQKQKEISERQLKFMKQGIWKNKDYQFNRGKIYEKRRSLSC